MWETLSNPWQACVEQAWEAYCAGTIPIGAVIVDHNGDVIVRARNRIYQDGELPFGAKNHEVMHAEMQAVLALDDQLTLRRTAELYTTTEPCPMCLGTWFMSNMGVLHFAARDPYAGSTNLLETTWYMRKKGKQAHGPAAPWLEDILTGLSIEAITRLEGKFPERLRTRSEPVLPRGWMLGKNLLIDPLLARLRERDAPVTDAVDYLAKKLETTDAHK